MEMHDGVLMPNLVTGWMTACDDGVKEIGSKAGKPGVPRLTTY